MKRCEIDDVPDLVRMGRDFHSYGIWRDHEYAPQAVETFLVNLLDKGAIFRTETGMCGGMLYPHWFSPSALMAVELFWWAKEGGSELKQAFEDWGREMGAVGCQFSAMADDKLPIMSRMFRRAGYQPVETGFLKVFS